MITQTTTASTNNFVSKANVFLMAKIEAIHPRGPHEKQSIRRITQSSPRQSCLPKKSRMSLHPQPAM